MGQWRPASGAPNLKRANPISAIVGAIVIGPTNRNSRPMIPLAPTEISTKDPAIMAPCTCCIRTSQPALARAAMPQIANVGAKKENVPPWTIGRRFPKAVCKSVVIPLTKNMVAINQPFSTGSIIPNAGANISGIATVEPNMVR